MLDYGPQTAAENQTCNPLDISAMKAVAEAKSFTPTFQHQMCRPSITNPYKVAETAERILIEIIHANQQADPMAKLTENDLVSRAVSRSMKLAKALHDEFKKYEDEIERAAIAKSIENAQKDIEFQKYCNEAHEQFVKDMQKNRVQVKQDGLIETFIPGNERIK